jgi:thiol-disulfide isomerase/thioredoxin
MKLKKALGMLLTAFLLVSIGVAIGKEMALRAVLAPAQPVVPAGQSKVIVYYMHGFPCPTCTFIETTTEKLVREEFAAAVAGGAIQFVSVDYLKPENQHLADMYSVGENMVVAVRFEDGREAARVRLDRVMELASDGEALKQYVRKGLLQATEGGGE